MWKLQLGDSARVRLGLLVDERGRGNAFDVLRLSAAIAVLGSHALPLTGHRETVGHESAGHLGVCVFFAISGFLVTRSWALHPRPLSFAIKRALRLMPALLVLLFVTVLVLGPVVTTSPPGTYFTSSHTHAYLVGNALFQTRYVLPGVFSDVPFAHVVNGSLWTLPLEAKCYALVVVLGLLGCAGRRPWASALVAVAALALTLPGISGSLPHGRATAAFLDGGGGLELVALFAAASLLFTVRQRVPVTWPAIATGAALWAATTPLGAHRFFTVLLLPYVVIGLAYHWNALRVRRLLRGRDLSYGTYLYAFPAEQLVAQTLGPGPVVMVLMTLPATLGLAALSWRFVERPALHLKRRRLADPALPGGLYKPS
jgi:peptidoglycan/LPS O-acetylase OafA/YrhL